MGKMGWFHRNMKKVFLVAVGVAVIALIITLVTLRVLYLSGVLRDEIGVSIYSVLVDIVVGVFTVWGLCWAAGEFARAQVKPDLRLIIGKETDLRSAEPLMNESDALIGQDVPKAYTDYAGDPDLVVGKPASLLAVGLFLENTRPKAAQYVRVVLRVHGVPCPEKFVPVNGSFEYAPRVNVVRGEAIFLQFGDDLVVYKGDGVYLGKIWVIWPQGTHPEKITFVADLYSLEGEPKEVTVSHPIHWIERET